MNGKVLGVPLVLIVLVVVILVPVAFMNKALGDQVAQVNAVCSQKVASIPTVAPSEAPTATPSASVSPLKRTVVPVTTKPVVK